MNLKKMRKLRKKYVSPTVELFDTPELMNVGPNANSDPNHQPDNPITPQPGDESGDDGEGMAKYGTFENYNPKNIWE